ncbi:MAG: FG-GAP-like repeat-containing protein [Bacteroidota bacterium]
MLVLLSASAESQSVLVNPGFESGTAPWQFYTNGAGALTAVAGNGSPAAARVAISTQGTNVQIYQSGFPLEANTQYTLTFKAYSNTGHDLSIHLLRNTSPYTPYGLTDQFFNLTTTWNTYSVQFTTTGFSGSTTDARLRFWLSPYDANNDQYFFDDVMLSKVGDSVRIVSQPVSQAVVVGEQATFSVTASGTPPLVYQWQKNGIDIAGATASSYATGSVTVADSGSTFVCIVTNAYNSRTSNVAMLTVYSPPTVSVDPENQTVNAGGIATFTVAATGTGQLSYQWQKNGDNILGATTNSYSTPQTLSSDDGSTYRCIVTNPYGVDTSNAATLKVLLRVTDGLLAMYAFEEGSGTTVKDVSGVSPSLHLTINNSGAVNWVSGGLSVNSSTLVASPGAATKLTNAIKASNQVTVEAWVKPANTIQKGPARIVTLSSDPNNRNVTLSQGLWGSQPGDLYNVRLRTTSSGANGHSELSTPSGSLTAQVTHVLYTRDTAGNEKLYVNGVESATTIFGGDLSNWNTSYRFALANELTSDRPWLGEYHLVAIYGKSFSPEEVIQNFAAGPSPDINQPPNTAFVASPPIGPVPLIVDFDATTSSDSDGWIVSYLWDFGDGATASGLMTTHQYNATGEFVATLTAMDNLGASSSSSKSITVGSSPTITMHPTNKTVEEGRKATFFITASGTSPLAYQWRKNNINIAGATLSSYTTPTLTLSDSGSTFRCIVTNFAGSATSNSATLSVTPSIPQLPYLGIPFPIPGTVQIEDFDNGGEGVAYHDLDDVNEGGEDRPDEGVDIQGTSDVGRGYNIGWTRGGEWLEYTVNVKLVGVYTIDVRVASEAAGSVFHIEFDGVDMTGPVIVPSTGDFQTWQMISISGVSLDAGVQIMRLALDTENETGSAGNFNFISISAGLPSITNQPSDQTIFEGQQATFSVLASSTSPLAYQWQKNEVNISGATGASYTTPFTTITDSGSRFRCIISNTAGTTISNSATLSLLPSPFIFPQWIHLVSGSGELPVPNGGTQQTASLVLDVDGDDVNDFVIAERTSIPSLVWYKRTSDGWIKHVVDSTILRIEAGGASHDIDGDGDLDIVFGGDTQSEQIWWWENPSPNFNPDTPWSRYLIKNSGATQHHDEMFGDFTGDGQAELIFWNQGANTLFRAAIPVDPRNDQPWQLTPIFTYTGDRREGFAHGDIDGDGLEDIVGGGDWFKYNGNGTFTAHEIDGDMVFTRAAVGQLKSGGRPEVVFQAGDWDGPLRWYEWDGSSWLMHELIARVRRGHSMDVGDINGDGYPDIFSAEMRLDGGNSNAKIRSLLGDGQGNFTLDEVASGVCNHESRLADLDGDGDLDILGKPYNWNTPRIDAWLNNGTSSSTGLPLDLWQRRVVDTNKPWRAVFITAADMDGDTRKDIITGGWWYKNPGTATGNWLRNVLGAPLNNMAAVYDFNGDGKMDVLGTQGQGATSNAQFVWARNNGSGVFSILNNIQNGDGDFLQGVEVARFQGGNLEVALSWHAAGRGIQMLAVPADPSTGTWTWRQASTTSQDEQISQGDIDRDGDIDLALGTKWLRNNGASWSGFTMHGTGGDPDRNRLADINGDGRLDVVVGFEAVSVPGKFAWYEQPVSPTGTWTERVISALVVGPMSMDVADMDTDGDFDVVVGEHNLVNSASARLIIFENANGIGTSWVQHVVHTGDEHHDGARVFDMDNDGDLDIISIGWNNAAVLLYENRAITSNSAFHPTSTNSPNEQGEIPTEFSLSQNFPNPFNPSTTIHYALPQPTNVRLTIYNTLGEQVATLINRMQPVGRYSAVWDATGVASGVYVYRLEAGAFIANKLMIVLK